MTMMTRINRWIRGLVAQRIERPVPTGKAAGLSPAEAARLKELQGRLRRIRNAAGLQEPKIQGDDNEERSEA